MASVEEIVGHLDELLDAPAFEDYGPNGLQVPGAAEASRIATGVSAGLELFERARDEGAQLVLVHHGLFWNAAPRALSPAMARRLKTLLGAGIALAAYHLPLDAHPQLGNNALIADALGLEDRAGFAEHRGRAIGVRGRLPGEGLALPELVGRVRDLCGQEPLAFDSGPERLRTIGIVSGGAARYVSDAVDEGLDAFLTGEPTESVMNEARDAGIAFVAGGHYATETFGIRRLGELVAERFGVEHVWIDIPNPV